MKHISGAIILENLWSYRKRFFVGRVIEALVVAGALIGIGLFGETSHIALGLFLIGLALLLVLKYLNFFLASTVVRMSKPTFLSQLFTPGQIVSSLKNYPVGRDVIARLGLKREDLYDARDDIQSSSPDELSDLGGVLGFAFDNSVSLRQVLMKQNITRETLLTAAKWAEADFLEEMHKVMPISRTAGRVGRSIAFGQAYLLDRFKLSFSQFGVTFGTESHQEEVESLSMILGKSREANAILVGDDKLSLYTILFNYGLRTERRVVLFDDSGFLAAFTDKSEFEKNLIRLVNEVSRAGDIVLVFPDFAEFMESASIRGSDVVMLLDPFFASSSMQIIATSTRDSYSRHFEHNPSLSTRFEKVMVQAETKESLEQFVVSRIKEVESREKVYFTAGALVTVRDAVMRFSPELMIDAADDLLHESVAKARSEKFKVIRSEHLLSLVESRTGVPVTAVSSAERTKLSKLEDLLRERIVGQEEAVSAISSALRRARAGVSSEKRPMGSFLFLGPTGVGKTETTKALSDIFFGTGAPMVRFDMSEYNDGSALERLLGSFEGNHPGTLASALREHEYGVLLLDEFEKTDKRVIDLFLQILDEGMFSDSRGKQVNVRNHIIVATSNAGSDTIFNFIKEGKNINTEKDAIIHDIINRGIFKPELLNRFDGTILFHPLTEDNLRAIARLMLNSLNKRLKAKGFELIINDEIVEFLVKKGQDPKFGARPLNRAIQDHIEANIAKKMLEGAIKAGDAITFRAGELNA